MGKFKVQLFWFLYVGFDSFNYEQYCEKICYDENMEKLLKFIYTIKDRIKETIQKGGWANIGKIIIIFSVFLSAISAFIYALNSRYIYAGDGKIFDRWKKKIIIDIHRKYRPTKTFW